MKITYNSGLSLFQTRIDFIGNFSVHYHTPFLNRRVLSLFVFEALQFRDLLKKGPVFQQFKMFSFYLLFIFYCFVYTLYDSTI